jgi:hypothetical protein
MDNKRLSIPVIELSGVIEDNVSTTPEEANKYLGRRRSDAFSFSGDDFTIGDNVECTQKQESLINTTLQVVRLKDFANEVRCKRDIDIFVENASVLLDCEELDLESIIVKMLLVSMLYIRE